MSNKNNKRVCIIGGGTAGLFLARIFANDDFDVTIVEQGTETHHQKRTAWEFNKMLHKGVLEGFGGGLGGTSRTWGGAFLPANDSQFNPEDRAQRIAIIDELFQLGDDGYGLDLDQCGFLKRKPKWASFKNRNTYRLISGLPVRIIHGEVVDLEIAKKSISISSVCYLDEHGEQHNITADYVILSAGAFESTKILLELAHKDRRFANESLGKNLHDHTSTAVASIKFPNQQDAADFIFKIEKNVLRNTRYEFASKSDGQFDCFWHVIFTRAGDDAFEALRRIFQCRQRSQLPQSSDIKILMKNMPWMIRFIAMYLLKGQILPPQGAGFEIVLTCPQERGQHSIQRKKDGSFLICWEVSDRDRMYFLEACRKLREQLSVFGWPEGTQIEWYEEKQIEHGVMERGDIFHPAGTIPFGEGGLVSGCLRVKPAENLFVASTAVINHLGAASPTHSLFEQCLIINRAILRDRSGR